MSERVLPENGLTLAAAWQKLVSEKTRAAIKSYEDGEKMNSVRGLKPSWVLGDSMEDIEQYEERERYHKDELNQLWTKAWAEFRELFVKGEWIATGRPNGLMAKRVMIEADQWLALTIYNLNTSSAGESRNGGICFLAMQFFPAADYSPSLPSNKAGSPLAELTPIQAMETFMSEEEKVEIQKYDDYRISPGFLMIGAPKSHDEIMYWKRHDLLEPHTKKLIEKLRSGEWTATGIAMPMGISSKRQPLDKELWRELELFPDVAKAQIPSGLRVEHICIHLPEAVIRESTPAVVVPLDDPDAVGQATTNQVEREEATEDKSPSISFDEGVLKIGDVTMVYRGEKQIAVLQELVAGHHANKPIKERTLIDKHCPNTGSLEKLFKGSPNWEKLKLYILRQNGFVSLRAYPQE